MRYVQTTEGISCAIVGGRIKSRIREDKFCDIPWWAAGATADCQPDTVAISGAYHGSGIPGIFGIISNDEYYTRQSLIVNVSG